MSIRLKRPHTRKPSYPVGIDWSNPLAKGLEFVNIHRTLGSSTDSEFLTVLGDSKIYNASGMTAIDDVNVGRADKGTVTVSHSSTVLPPSGPTYSHVLYSSTGANSTSTYKGAILMLGNGNGYLQCRLHNPTASVAYRQADTASNALNDGKRHISSFAWDSATTGFLKLYSDGVNVASDTGVKGTAAAFTHGAFIGGSEDTFWGKYEGGLQFTFVHARALSDIEIKSLHDNPYQILQPRTQYIPIAAAGAIMNQLQGSNMGADLYNGTLL